jgi:hypothetical protein
LVLRALGQKNTAILPEEGEKDRVVCVHFAGLLVILSLK